jgi:putative transposase
MPRKLKRYHGRGDLHFVTFSCYERRALLGTVRARDLFLKILEQVRRRCAASVLGYVVMPEHVHLLLSEPRKGTLAKLLQVLKQRVSRAMRRRRTRRASGQLSLAFPASCAELRGFWQRRYYDFNVYSAQKMREKLDYIHTNPVKRKLVMHPKAWPWSSWAYYARGEQGVVMIEPTGEERGEKKAHPLQKPQRAGHPHHPGLGRVEWRCSRTCHRKNEMKG